jgi:hypothetical protein
MGTPTQIVADSKTMLLSANAQNQLGSGVAEPSREGPTTRALVSRFFAEYDQGASDLAWQMFSPKTQQILTLSDWRDKRAVFLRAAGIPLSHDIDKVTWLRDPANAPYPGLYGVFDVSCRYTLLQMCAEVIVLYSEKEGAPFTVMRHDQYSVEAAAVQRLCIANDTVQVNFGNGRVVQIKCPPKQHP